jgi:CBS-domain-containing membrane protein
MFTHSSGDETFGSNILTTAVIAGSALLLYAFAASPIAQPAARVAATPVAVHQVVVTGHASGHVS